MDAIRLDTREAILLFTLIGVGVGLLLGLVPLIYGRMKGKARLGLIGFVSCIVAGAIWSILPLIVMVTFVFLIMRKDPEPAEVGPATDLPVKVLPNANPTMKSCPQCSAVFGNEMEFCLQDGTRLEDISVDLNEALIPATSGKDEPEIETVILPKHPGPRSE